MDMELFASEMSINLNGMHVQTGHHYSLISVIRQDDLPWSYPHLFSCYFTLALEPHDGASIVSGISHPSNGDSTFLIIVLFLLRDPSVWTVNAAL